LPQNTNLQIFGNSLGKEDFDKKESQNLVSLDTANNLPYPGTMHNFLKTAEWAEKSTSTLVKVNVEEGCQMQESSFKNVKVVQDASENCQHTKTTEETVKSPFKDETKLADIISVDPKSTSPSDRDPKIGPLDQHDSNIKQEMLTAVFNHRGKNKIKMLKSNKLSSRNELKSKARVIPTDGGSRRKSSKVESIAKMDPSPSEKPVSESVKKTKPRKKVNSIIAMKDDKLAKGEILVPYELSQDTMMKKIEADRVDENITRVVRPILKKGSTVFNDTPQIQHTIKDMEILKRKYGRIPPKVSQSEHVKFIKDMEIHKAKDKSILLKVTQPEHVKQAPVAEFPKVAELVKKCYRNILKVNMPRQRLSQLKEKAERQDLTFKTRYYRHLKTKKDKTKLHKDRNMDVIDQGLNKRKIQEKQPSESEDLKACDKSLLPHRNEKSETPKRKLAEIEVKLSRNIKQMKKCEVQLEHFELTKSQRHDVKVWQNVGNEDAIIKKESEKYVEKNKSFKKDSDQEKYHGNKKHCETKRSNIDDAKSKKPKYSSPSTMDNTNRKLKEDLQQKVPKDLVKQLITKEGKKFETNDNKDFLKKFRPVNFPKPKPTIINHFQVYKPTIEGKNESPRRVGQHSKTPPTFKEKDKKNSDQCSQSVLGSPQFKIPKYKKGEQPAKKVVGFAPDRFLQNENIKVLKVGESTCSKLESLLMTAKLNSTENVPHDFGSPSLPDILQIDEIDEILDGISPLKNKMGSNRKHGAKEQEERNDILDEGWNKMKNLQTDPERMNLAQEQFKNPIGANPNNNVTYHGFKRRNQSIDHSFVSQRSHDLWDDQKNLPMYHLSNGEIKPLKGYKYNLQPKHIQSDCSSKEVNSKLKIGPFANFMKTVIYNNKCKKMKRGQELQFMEEFKTYLGHYKGGCEETINFLKFYQEEVELEDWQTREILAMEDQFSLFSGYYGDTDDLRCEECNKKHKFTN